MRPDLEVRPSPAVRGVIFAGFAALGIWHLSRLQSPSLAVADVIVLVLLAVAAALSARIGGRPFALALVGFIVATAALVGRAWPSRAHPLDPFSQSAHRLHQGGGRFATVVLPFDPVAEPGLHAQLLAGTAAWLLALALIWLVAARPLPTVVLGTVPLALVSTEFSQPRPGLRVALLVGLIVWTLAAGRRGGARRVVALAVPLVVVALVGAGLPGLARASFLDWRAWGRGAGDSSSAAGDVRFAWDQSYDGLHYTGEPVVVLRVRSPRPSYWRVTVLDSFDGLRFEERAPDATIAPAGATVHADPRPSGPVTSLQVETAALDEPYLVGAGNPVSFQVPESSGGGSIDTNGVVRVVRAPVSGTSYRISAVIADPSRALLRHANAGASSPSVDELDASPFAGEAPLPAFGEPGRETAVQASLAAHPGWRAAYAWGQRATAGAKTPFDVALALERTLRAGHPYNGSSTLPTTDPDALAHWIVSRDAGYCQMFSASMTELLRLLGVRARIAEGFATGRYDPASKSYVVDDRDAHAWVEAWLPGYGFVPFDPTPGRSLPTQASSSSGLDPAQTVAPSTTATPSAPTTTTPVPRTGSTSPRAADRMGGSTRWLVGVLALALVLLAVAVSVVRLAGRRRPPGGDQRAEVGAARALLASRARRRGLELPPGVTNGELAEALAARLEIDAHAWARAADQVAYAPEDEADHVLPVLRSETRRLAKEIRESGRVTLPA